MEDVNEGTDVQTEKDEKTPLQERLDLLRVGSTTPNEELDLAIVSHQRLKTARLIVQDVFDGMEPPGILAEVVGAMLAHRIPRLR